MTGFTDDEGTARFTLGGTCKIGGATEEAGPAWRVTNALETPLDDAIVGMDEAATALVREDATNATVVALDEEDVIIAAGAFEGCGATELSAKDEDEEKTRRSETSATRAAALATNEEKDVASEELDTCDATELLWGVLDTATADDARGTESTDVELLLDEAMEDAAGAATQTLCVHVFVQHCEPVVQDMPLKRQASPSNGSDDELLLCAAIEDAANDDDGSGCWRG